MWWNISAPLRWSCKESATTYFPSRKSISGRSMLSESASTWLFVLALSGPFIWYSKDAIWRTQSLMRFWKLEVSHWSRHRCMWNRAWGLRVYLEMCAGVLPVPKCTAELIQHAVELHLQVVQQITCLIVHLQKEYTQNTQVLAKRRERECKHIRHTSS